MASIDAVRLEPSATLAAAASPATSPATPSAAASVAGPAVATLDESTPASRPRAPTALLVKLLEMADGYAKTGAKHLALDLYFAIIDRYSEAPEADRARQRLMEIAQQYERAGETHQARSLYERLL
jgi:hypothetical protein